ncbi:murein biosynthesis integral membrane protein MurJ [Patescibacteria group bacterium]|nr:murein biosynthesis integral membrane protein MurJ [Patescibacteria group bacterium]
MLKKFFRNGLKNGAAILFQRQKTILSGAAAIAVMSLLSAVLGLVRKRLYAGLLAAGTEYDTLVAAFQIPDLIFQLLIAGSLNAAFIPLFSRHIVKEKAQKAWLFASMVLNLTVVCFSALAVLGFIFAPWVSRWLAPGFTLIQQQQTARLMRIIMLSPLLLGLSSFAGGMVQSFKRFLMPYFSPVAYNLGAIAGILFLYPIWGLEGMAWGVVIGSILHLLVILPLLRHLGFKYFPALSLRDASVRELLRLSWPRTIWAAVFQIKEVIIVNIASLLAAGSLSVLDYGQAIVRLPLSILGVSIAQASLPTLSEYAARQDMKNFKAIFINSFLQILYLLVPVSVVLVILKIPVVRLIFGTGKFAWWETVFTSWVVALLAISLFAQAGKELIVRAFYALKEANTPVIVGSGAALLGIVLSVALAVKWQVRGIALGLTISVMVEFLILLFMFIRRVELSLRLLVVPSVKIFFSAAVMAVAVYFPVQILDEVFIDTSKVINLVVLVWVVLTFGGSIYLFLTWFLGCNEIRLLFDVLLKIKNWRAAFISAAHLPPPTATFEGEEMGGVE